VEVDHGEHLGHHARTSSDTPARTSGASDSIARRRTKLERTGRVVLQVAIIRELSMHRSLALLSIVVLLGCGGASSSGFAESEPTIDHGTQSAHALIGVNPPPIPWHDMSQDDREMYMVGTILPISAESFRGYSAERFAQFECANCHGDDAAARNYEMPSRSLPPLAAPGTPGWQRMSEGPAYTFMNDVVVPEMATMLGEDRYDAQHPNGFGCFDCHPHAGS
jgi:hypothetical protein